MHSRMTALSLTAVLCLLGASAASQAQPPHEHGGPPPGAHPQPRVEPHPGPRGYQRIEEPHGWNARPQGNFDRGAYQHNFRAQRTYRIGPYHRPLGWAPHTWAYGQILPRAYFTPEYHISDYWLFGLEVPPVGYEWVRDDTDALLVSIDSGEILQVVHGAFG